MVADMVAILKVAPSLLKLAILRLKAVIRAVILSLKVATRHRRKEATHHPSKADTHRLNKAAITLNRIANPF